MRYILILILSFNSLINYAENFIAGKDYELLPVTNKNLDKKSVEEFFSYGCHWCFQLEPGVNKWVQEQHDITFTKVPVIFNADWEFYAKAYYTSVALGIEPKMTPLLFKAINVDKLSLNSNKTVADFFIKNGVKPEIANSAFNSSPAIEMQVKKAQQLMASLQINAVPTFVINNKFKTNLQMAQNENRLFSILDYLIKQ